MKKAPLTKRITLLMVLTMLFSQLNFYTFAVAGIHPGFSDTTGHYAESIIKDWMEAGNISGFPDGTFRPQESVTRAEFVALLNRVNRCNSSEGVLKTFSDVKRGTWYYDDIMQAAKRGVIAGYPDQHFGPDDPIMRQDVCVIISKCIPSPVNSDLSSVNKFIDKDEIADYAIHSVAAAAGLGIVNGRPDGTLAPQEHITRADAVIVLNNAHALYGNSISGDHMAKESHEISSQRTSPKSLGSSAETGSFNGNGSGVNEGGSGIDENRSPMLTINTSSFDPLFASETEFYVEDKISALTGTIADVANVSALSLRITCGNLETVKDSITPAANWRFPAPNLIQGENTVTISAVWNNGEEFEISIVLIDLFGENFKENQMDMGDNDGDGLLNWQEDVLGTDKNTPDTDDDGLTDYEEIYFTLGDPLRYSKNADGVSDGKQDYDHDGLDNIQECFYGTDPYRADTDLDGLSDYDEIFVYFSNPILTDSDGDGLLDAQEVVYGMDLMNPDTLGDGILDGDRTFSVTVPCDDLSEDDRVQVSVMVDLQGKQIDSLLIDKVSELDIFLNPDIPGYLGNAVDLTMDGAFSAATLVFEFDKSLLDEPDFVPAIYYWDEDAQLLLELPDQHIDGNKVSVKLMHFSKYILLNKNSFDKSMETASELPPDEADSMTLPMDVVFSIDSTDSMNRSDPSGLRRTATMSFVDKLRGNDHGAVVAFSGTAYLRSELTADITALYNAIDTIRNAGATTSNYSGFQMALEQFSISSREAHRYIVILTDGKDTETHDYTPLIKDAIAKNITVFTIGLGKSLNATMLEKIAESTGGKYYHASNAVELEGIFENISEDVQADTDGDGLSDIYERLINNASLKLGNGAPLSGLNGEKLSWNDPNNKDSDGDGLMDGEEIEVVTVTKANGADWTYIKMISNPLRKDSDGDGYPDFDEIKKHKSNPLVSDVIITRLKNKNFVDVVDGSFHYYGGNQSWWEGDFERNGGCSVVAAANVSAYLSTSESKYKDLYRYPTFSKVNFTDYMTEFLEYIQIEGPSFFPVGVWSMSKFQHGIEEYAKDHAVTLKGVLSNQAFTVDNVTGYIVNGLSKDKPVAVLIGVNAKLKKVELCYPDGNRTDPQSLQRHWVAVTELEEDKIAGSIIAKVSTWGFYAYIDIKDYVEGELFRECVIYFE